MAGSVNRAIAFALGAGLPTWPPLLGGLLVDFLTYGVSLALFVIALRQLGTARTGTYFSTAPFFGAILAVGLGEELTNQLLIAGALMALGVWLHLSESHIHTHIHPALWHSHRHRHHEHHRHTYDFPWDGKEPHTHHHEEMEYTHAHFPDAHHRHRH